MKIKSKDIKEQMFDYKDEFNKAVNNIIQKFIEDISNKFTIDKDKLNDLWESKDKNVEKEDNTKEKAQKLKLLKKKELEELCKQKGLSEKGKKEELINRLISNVNKTDTVINTILTGLSSITIVKNKYGNYEHSSTKFIFNKSNKLVIGKQEGEKVISLTERDIEICNQYKFKYRLPENLNNEEGSDDTNIVDKQIEDDVFEEEDEEEDEDEDDS